MNIKAFTEKTLSDLRAFGLTGHEAAIYLALIEHSSSTASEVCTYCGIPDSKVYIALNSLLSKGMIIAQNSTPKIYSVNPPAEAIELLKNELRTVYEAKFKDADELIDTLTLMYEANNENEVSEVAYIIRSYPAIIKRMNKLIKDSKKYVMVLINDESILEGLSGALKEAAHKGVLDIALPKGLLEVAPKELKAVELFCPCNIVVSDSRNLITLSEIPNRSALLLNDRTLIEAVKQYFKKNR